MELETSVATARAHPNIAFIKYWGNRDHHLRLPANSSLSMNLDGLFTETTVTWDPVLRADTLTLNGQVDIGPALERVRTHLEMLRKHLGISAKAHVESANNFPTGAGIASSASSFAALTVAAVYAAGVHLSERELTTLARLGSGSASRSIPPGFVQWHAGETHMESFAESIAAPDHWALADVIAVVNQGHKRVGSTEGHQSADTSDLHQARVAGAQRRLEQCKSAIQDRDFSRFAEVVELDSNLMHSVMMTSRPPLFYWLPPTLDVMERVRALRADGLEVCYTLDAGPNVHCICVRNDAPQVIEALEQMSEVLEVRVARPGGGAVVV